MSGLSFFQHEGFDESFGESSANFSFHNHDPQDQNMTDADRLSTKLALRRLLYRMERHEDLTVLQDEATPTSESNDNARENSHYQSWQSLLVRAQLCQDLWRTVASENVDEGSDPELRREYMELSQRVDAACKRAHVLAYEARGRDVDAKRDKNLVGKLFFSQVSDDETDEGNPTTGQDTVGGDSDEADDYYDEFEEDDESEADEIPSRRTKTSHPSGGDNTNLQDLQKAQREQIEEAIAMMAKQMKESTQGIRKTLQKQNASTLNELETVAEQNMEDVSKVAANVKDHVVANQRSSWASWTTMILIVGVFVFTLLTIFTVPKHPDASLGRILSNENGPYARLIKKTVHGIKSVFSVNFLDSEEQDETMLDTTEEDETDWNQYDIQEEEAARLERERLEALVREMQHGGRKPQQQQQQQQEKQKREEEERLKQQQREAQEKLRQKQLEQEERLRHEQLERERQEKIKQEKLEQQKQDRERREKMRQQKRDREKRKRELEQKQEEEKLRQQKLEEEEKLRKQKEQERVEEQKRLEKLKENLSDELPKQKIFARDLRAAAYTDNYQALEQYLKDAPYLINEQDEDGWTALHLAVKAKHPRIVRLLLMQDDEEARGYENIDPNMKLFGENQPTAFQLAVENLGLDHPVTQVFFDLEWFDDDKKEELRKLEETRVHENNPSYKGELPYSNEDVTQRINNYDGFKKPRGNDLQEDDTYVETPSGLNPEDVFDEEESDENDESKPAKQVNVDDIFASLQMAQEKQQEQPHDDPMPQKDAFDKNDVESFNPARLIDREGVAAKMVSPREFRLAAADNDYDALIRYLKLAPEHINRQDKNGWTALHMAVHAKHQRIVSLLLDRYDEENDESKLNIDPFVTSKEDNLTAFDLALEQFGLDHPITGTFFDSGWYDRSDYTEEKIKERQKTAEEEEQARLREKFLREHKARIAKEQEANRIKEAKIVAAREEERRLKKDKLDRLFKTPVEDENDDIDDEAIQERRSRLDAILEEL